MQAFFGRRASAILAGALVLTGVLAVASDAGHQTPVTSITGCLNQSTGLLARLAVGNAPSSPCSGNQVLVHLSGGDITEVVAGVGLSGGAAAGVATLDLDFADLGSCPAGSAIRANGVAATCEADDDTTYVAGSGLTLAGTTFATDDSVVQARVTGTCDVGSAVREITQDGLVVCEPIPTAPAVNELLLIQRHEFDANTAYFMFDTPGAPGTREWEMIETGLGEVQLDPELEPGYVSTSALTLNTNGGTSSAIVHGNRQASVTSGTLIFKAHVLDAYAEAGAVYGNAQPRGLRNGAGDANAIEFQNTLGFTTGGFNTGTKCRTASGGVATETSVSIDQWTRRPAMYQIVATATEARFYVNGVLECTHTTNIPTVGLNLFFGTSSNTGNIPLAVDWASFELRPNQ